MTLAVLKATNDPLREALLDRVSRIVQDITGVQLGSRQRSMVEARVSRRIVDLGLAGTDEYARYLDKHAESEAKALVALLTTHHTFFLREFEHFEFFRDRGLKALATAGKKHLKVWAMACSRGQEVYSLAMFLSVHWPRMVPGGTFDILGTDVDDESVQFAANGVYRIDEIKTVPALYAGTHWARGTGAIANFVKAKDSLRRLVRFGSGNLMELKRPSPGEAYDLIFCRNVFIYFTAAQIATVTERILPYLDPAGYFVIGTTESLSGLKLPVAYLGTSIYQRESLMQPLGAAAAPKISMPSPSPSTPTKLIRVFCVDDSPTVLVMLKSMLTLKHGFEIVGTAMDGQKAAEIAKTLAFDVMTLDIHMPVKTGVDYLRERAALTHPPIVMLSSISREETTLGVKALELGAVDYVEKPSLANIDERGDELRTKLRCAVAAFASGDGRTSSSAAFALAGEMARRSKVQHTGKTLRVIIAGVGDRPKVKQLLKSLAKPQAPTLILFEGPSALAAALAATFQQDCDLPVRILDVETKASLPSPSELADSVWIVGLDSGLPFAAELAKDRLAVTLVYDSVSTRGIERVKAQSTGTLVLEETVGSSHKDQERRRGLATQVLPYTSLLFDTDYLLNRDET